MRAALILPSQFPNGPKLAAAGIDTVYKRVAEPGTPALTAVELDELRKFFLVGIFRVATWDVSISAFNAMTPDEQTAWARKFAKKCSDDLVNLASPSYFSSVGPPKQCYVNAEAEYQSSLFWLEFLREWRRQRSSRKTWISLQAMQGGWMGPDLVQQINADANLQIAPFHYDDNMKKIDGSMVALNLVKQGIRWERITGYKSLREPLESWWDGIAYLENWEQLA